MGGRGLIFFRPRVGDDVDDDDDEDEDEDDDDDDDVGKKKKVFLTAGSCFASQVTPA